MNFLEKKHSTQYDKINFRKKKNEIYIYISSETWQAASPIAEHHSKDASVTDSRASRCQSPTGIKIQTPKKKKKSSKTK